MLLALSLLTYAVGLALIVLVIMQRKEPTATLAWILTIIFIPIFGILFYLWFGFGRIERKVQMRRRSNRKIAEQLREIERTLIRTHIVPEYELRERVQHDLVKMTEGLSAFAVTHGNRIELLTDPAAVFTKLLQAIDQAQDSIHMEYYIFRRDATGKAVRDHLIAAAKRGVIVRLLVDGVGSWAIGDVFIQPLRKAGAHFAHYLPVTFLGRPWHWNFRNHRKISVFDGTTAFIGSLNIGDEYRERQRSLDFYDEQIACEGPVVEQLQEVFAGDWFFATGENLAEHRYFPVPVRCGGTLAQVVESGPDEPTPMLHEMICAAIHAAQKSVRIVTPYFIPDQALLVALRTAALRGVAVELMVPARMPNPHEWVVWYAGRSYYEDLLENGVRIYEYLPGFLHGKEIVVDGSWASIGTANMDIRSFRLNFEVNINVYSKDAVAILEENFRKNLKSCREITAAVFAERPVRDRVIENVVRVLSPIL